MHAERPMADSDNRAKEVLLGSRSHPSMKSLVQVGEALKDLIREKGGRNASKK